MKTVVGTFTSHADAERAVRRLHELGIPLECMNLLTPGASQAQIEQVPTEDTERPGIGKAIGGVVGGAMGASGGLLGAAVVSALIPGVGAVTAIGLAASALLGVGGVAAGVAAGGALEDAMSAGLPKDELFIYEDALRQGRTVVFVLTEDNSQRHVAREVMDEMGAESLDAARETWWVGLRDAEAEVYTGGDFAADETVYRQGFEAAFQSEIYGKPYEAVGAYLRRQYPDVWEQRAFRDGYERGRNAAVAMHKRYPSSRTSE